MKNNDEMPERIWLSEHDTCVSFDNRSDCQSIGHTSDPVEFVRADLARPVGEPDGYHVQWKDGSSTLIFLREEIEEFDRPENIASVRPSTHPPSQWVRHRQPIETAPKDGKEFIACWPLQGDVMQIVRWDVVHEGWLTKRKSIHLTSSVTWTNLPQPPKDRAS